MTAQVVGQRINTVHGCFHVQAADEILGVVFVEVKSQLDHIFPLLWLELTQLVFGGAVLRGDRDGSIGNRQVLLTLFQTQQTEAAPADDDGIGK